MLHLGSGMQARPSPATLGKPPRLSEPSSPLRLTPVSLLPGSLGLSARPCTWKSFVSCNAPPLRGRAPHQGVRLLVMEDARHSNRQTCGSPSRKPRVPMTFVIKSETQFHRSIEKTQGAGAGDAWRGGPRAGGCGGPAGSAHQERTEQGLGPGFQPWIPTCHPSRTFVSILFPALDPSLLEIPRAVPTSCSEPRPTPQLPGARRLPYRPRHLPSSRGPGGDSPRGWHFCTASSTGHLEDICPRDRLAS